MLCIPQQNVILLDMRGEGVFASVDLALISHHHKDHYQSAATLEFFRAHPETRFAWPSTVTDDLARTGAAWNALRTRGTTWNLSPGESGRVTENGVKIEAVAVPHVRDVVDAVERRLAVDVVEPASTASHDVKRPVVGDAERRTEAHGAIGQQGRIVARAGGRPVPSE